MGGQKKIATQDCRYGDKCRDKDACTFKHDSVATIPQKKIATKDCRYGDKCHDKDACTFKHDIIATIPQKKIATKDCRYGDNCRDKDACTFKHEDASSVDTSVLKKDEALQTLPHISDNDIVADMTADVNTGFCYFSDEEGEEGEEGEECEEDEEDDEEISDDEEFKVVELNS